MTTTLILGTLLVVGALVATLRQKAAARTGKAGLELGVKESTASTAARPKP